MATVAKRARKSRGRGRGKASLAQPGHPGPDKFLEAIVYTPQPPKNETEFTHIKADDLSPESVQVFLSTMKNLSHEDRVVVKWFQYNSTGEKTFRSFIFARIGLSK